MQAGYDGLLRDKTRPSRIPPLGADMAKRVVALTRTDPPASDRFDPLVCDTGTPGVSVAASGMVTMAGLFRVELWNSVGALVWSCNG